MGSILKHKKLCYSSKLEMLLDIEDGLFKWKNKNDIIITTLKPSGHQQRPPLCKLWDLKTKQCSIVSVKRKDRSEPVGRSWESQHPEVLSYPSLPCPTQTEKFLMTNPHSKRKEYNQRSFLWLVVVQKLWWKWKLTRVRAWGTPFSALQGSETMKQQAINHGYF